MLTHRIAGRKYVLALLEARPRKVRSKGHEYIQYVINVPKKLAVQLEEMNRPNEEAWKELDPEDQGPHPIPLTVLVTPSPWHHLVDWDEMSARAYLQLSERTRKELEALGLGPVAEKERVLIPARPDELRELGLDPDQPLTLEDVIEAVKRRLATGTPSQEAQASPKPA